jgi:hypothetical protein
MEVPALFALGVVRMHRWTPGCSHYSLTDTLHRDEVDFFRCSDELRTVVTPEDLLRCGQLLIASLRVTQAAPTLRATDDVEFEIDGVEGEEEDEEELEEEIFNREIDAVVFRDWMHAAPTPTPLATGRAGAGAKAQRDEDGIFFHLPERHAKFLTMQGVAVPEPRFKRTFYVQQEVCFLVVVSNVPFQAYLKERLQELAADVFAQSTGDGALASFDAVDKFFLRLTGSIQFHELPYREIHVGLPVVSMVKWFGKDTLAILRVLLLEGRVMCYSTNPALASSATLALLALLPGVLSSVHSEFTSRTIQAVVYRLRRYGMPFALFQDDCMLQPCFAKDQMETVYSTSGFLVGTSDPLLSKQPNAKLDLIVDLDNRHVVTFPTVKTEYAFAFGASTAAFGDSLAERFGRNLGVASAAAVEEPNPPGSRTGSRTGSLRQAARTASGKLAQARTALARRKSVRTKAPSAVVVPTNQSDVEWVLSQFQSYFEHFLDEAFNGVFRGDGSSIGDADGQDEATTGNGKGAHPSLYSRIEDLAAPIFSEHAKFYGEYGRAWVHAWQQTSNFDRWLSARRVERRRSTIATAQPPPQEGRSTYTYPNGDEYDGEWRQGKRHGKGVYIEYLTKNQYEGDWRDDLRHGKGILSARQNGYIYDGDWQHDVRCGRGHSSLKNVENYAGEWRANRFHGMGVYSNAQGDVYDGEWQRGLREGMGKLTCERATADENEEFGGLKQYVGEWRAGRFHGTGTAQYMDGTQYSGTFEEGKRHGTGLLFYANGDRYEGQWWKGFRHGEGSFFSATSGMTKEGAWRKNAEVDGTWFLVYANGDKYTGACRRGRPWGEGVCKYANGSSYAGAWVDGLREGFGVLVNTDGSLLEGEWNNSAFVQPKRAPSKFVEIPLASAKPSAPMRTALSGLLGSSGGQPSNKNVRGAVPPEHGSHVFVYPNGDRYEGDFQKSLRHGKGVFTERATGTVYDGEWRHDQRHGNGVLTSGMKDFIYDGKWEHNMRAGYGHCVIRGCETYTGYWRANQFHGTGKYIDAEGNVYDGEFAHGQKHGMGKQMFTVQKEAYSGEWKRGRRDGTGDATFADGAKYSGSWKNDVRDGEGTFTSAAGERYTGQWRNGIREGSGVLVHPTTGITKEGSWLNDEPVDGEWTILFPDGSKFTGECVKGRPHGRGVCKYASGDLYDGQWVNGTRHGHGIGFFANGDSFIGDWENNHVALNGKGELTLADGTVHVYSK